MATGELVMFKEIWEERLHVSEVKDSNGNDIPLPAENNKLWIWCFAHILPKGIYGKARLAKENIILLHPSQHHLFDHFTHKVRDKPEWAHVFKKKEELKQLYHSGYFDKL